MWQWILSNSSGLQTLAALAGTLIAFVGFLVLCLYAWDTRKIARATQTQYLDNVIPFLSVVIGRARDGRTKTWTLHNHGFGPAIHIRHTSVEPQISHQRMPPIMQGEQFKICDVETAAGKTVPELLTSEGGFIIDYDSIAGESFRTVCRTLEPEGVHVDYQNLSRPYRTKRRDANEGGRSKGT